LAFDCRQPQFDARSLAGNSILALGLSFGGENERAGACEPGRKQIRPGAARRLSRIERTTSPGLVFQLKISDHTQQMEGAAGRSTRRIFRIDLAAS
jgi:hypothetical protein